jgi:hypothetical protein
VWCIENKKKYRGRDVLENGKCVLRKEKYILESEMDNYFLGQILNV